MINLLLWIGTMILVYVLLLTILLMVWRDFNRHLKDNFPQIVMTFLAILLSSSITICGVFWSFKKNTERAYKTEVDTFKRSFVAVMGECAGNLACINKLKKEINSSSFNLLILSDEIAGSLIVNPMLYKFTGEEYLYALKSYVTNVKLVNKMLNLVFDDFKSDGRILDENIKDLNSLFNDCLYYLYILEYQTQNYVYLYDVRFGQVLNNSDKIIELLEKKNKIIINELIDELKLETDNLKLMSDGERKILQDKLKKALEE